MSAPVIRPEVKTFVAAVRDALGDLGPDEVEELTGGLEADLDDALSDAGGIAEGAGGPGELPGELADRLGDPAAYAAELRAAAGLPPRAAGGVRPGTVGSVAEAVRRVRERGARAVRRVVASRWWPPIREYGRMLLPVWWVLRAWIAFQVLHGVLSSTVGSVLPQSLRSSAVAVVVLVISVELGRRTISAERSPLWQNPSRRRLVLGGLVIAADLLAVLAAPAALAHVYHEQSPSLPVAEGLWLNGTEVRNVFPYDAQGRPLSGVQLFDENGNHLAVGASARVPLFDPRGNEVVQVPAVGQDSSQLWNVFPLRQQVIPSYAGPAQPPQPADRAMPSPPSQPFLTAGSLLAPTPGPAARVTPSAAVTAP